MTGAGTSCLVALALAAPSSQAADPLVAKSYPKGVAHKLVVETDSGPIAVRQTKDGPTTVDLTPAAPGDDCRVVRDLRGDTLRLTVHAARNTFGMSKTCSSGFSVSTSISELQARSGSGGVSFDVYARKVDVRTGSGAIEVMDAMGAADLSLRSGSGTISGSAPAARVDAQTGSGDIRLTALTGLVKARSGSGAVSLDWDAAPASGAIEVNTGSGGLDAAFPKGTKLRTSLRSAAGDVRSDFDDKDAKLTLAFKSGSGGATVTRKP